MARKYCLNNISIKVDKGDKIAFVGPNDQAKDILFKILTRELKADHGSFDWGVTTSQAYFPKDNARLFRY